MEALLVWLEASSLGQLMRAAGVWAYGVVNLIHILGVATLLGAVLVLDLRLLGLWRRIPLAMLERPAVSLGVCGFIVAATSGICLATTNATEYLGNPFVPIKFTAIGLGLVNVLGVQALASWRMRHAEPELPRQRLVLALVGGLSLACWLTAASAGRMIGYW